MGNTFGTIFRLSTFGESHGPAVGVTVDGCPGGVPVAVDDVQAELDRRRPGQSDLTTPREEADRVEILSGVYEGKTTGAPIVTLTNTLRTLRNRVRLRKPAGISSPSVALPPFPV